MLCVSPRPTIGVGLSGLPSIGLAGTSGSRPTNGVEPACIGSLVRGVVCAVCQSPTNNRREIVWLAIYRVRRSSRYHRRPSWTSVFTRVSFRQWHHQHSALRGSVSLYRTYCALTVGLVGLMLIRVVRGGVQHWSIYSAWQLGGIRARLLQMCCARRSARLGLHHSAAWRTLSGRLASPSSSSSSAYLLCVRLRLARWHQ